MNPQQDPNQLPQQPYPSPPNTTTESLGQTAVNAPVPIAPVPPAQPQGIPTQEAPFMPPGAPIETQAPQANTPPQVDASQFFQSSVPAQPPVDTYQTAPTPTPPVTPQPLFAPDALPPDGGYAPEPSHKKRLLLVTMLITISLVLTGSAFMLLRPKGKSANSQPDAANADIAAGIENGDFLSTVSESPESNTIVETTESTSENEEKNEATSTDTDKSTSNTSSSPSPSPSKPKPSTTVTKSTAPSNTFKCVLTSTKYKSQVTDPALNQAAKSVLTARGGGTSKLLAWVPTIYRNEASGRNASDVDASYKKYQPKNCNVEFAYSIPKMAFTERAIVLVVTFDKTTASGKYFSQINVAYSKGAWRTYGMSDINKVP